MSEGRRDDWPLASNYSNMLQNPKVAFRDPELQRCTIKTRPGSKQPLGLSGFFAVVFKGTYPNGKSVAVRAFTQQVPERRERYVAVHDYLQHKRPRSFVGFDYSDNGIRSTDARWYPLVTMEWVTGETLFKWVHARCGANDRRRLAAAAAKWCELLAELREYRIAHGDLQHANVMVTERDELKLVDYDCVCVPALVGRPNLEIGVCPYQHPERDGNTPLSLRLDDYSGLFILTALKALAADPGLWGRYIEGREYDKLLFHPDDFAQGAAAPIYRDLQRSPDTDVRELTQALFELRRGRMADVPAWDAVLASYPKFEQLAGAGALREAAALLKRRPRLDDAPPKVAPLVREVLELAPRLDELEKAVEAGDESAMRRLLDRRLEKYADAAEALRIARDAPRAAAILAALEQLRRQGQWRQLERLWQANAPLLSGRRSAEPYRKEVERWRERNALLTKIEAAWKARPVDAAALQPHWDQLSKLGGHPEAAPIREPITRFLARHGAWSRFVELSQSSAVGETRDRQLVAAWREDLFADWEPAFDPRHRQRLTVARRAVTVLDRLAAVAAKNGAPTLPGERAVIEAAAAVPPKYPHALQDRVRLAEQRVQAHDALRASLSAGSDRAIASAWRALSAVQGEALVSDRGTRERVELAVRRAAVIEKIVAISSSENLPPDRADRELLAAWGPHEQILAGCRDVADRLPRFVEAKTRRRLLDRLADVLRAHGERPTLAGEQAILKAASALPPKYPHEWRERIDLARRRVAAWAPLAAALASGSDRAIVRAWDALTACAGESLLTDPASRERVDLARRRLPVIERILSFPNDLPADELDRELLDAWEPHEELLADCRDVADRQRRYAEAGERRRLIQEMTRAAEAHDSIRLASLVTDPLLAGYPLPEGLDKEVASAHDALTAARGLLKAIEDRDAGRFFELFDAGCIARFPHLFRPQSERIAEMARQEVLPLDRLQLKKPMWQPIASAGVNGTYRVKWGFPRPRFTDACVLAVCGREPHAGEDPQSWQIRWSHRVHRQAFQNARGGFPVHPQDDWSGCWVAVWALVDVCAGEPLRSDPLVLGQLI